MTAHEDSPDVLLAQLDADPKNLVLRARTARQLAASERHEEAFNLLAGSFAHLTSHDDPAGPAPCLCRKCARPELDRVEIEGETFVREFAIEKGRVLYFWMPRSLRGDADAVRAAVQARMKKRLRG